MSFSPQDGEAAADLGAAAPTVNVLERQATRFCGKPDAYVCIRAAGPTGSAAHGLERSWP